MNTNANECKISDGTIEMTFKVLVGFPVKRIMIAVDEEPAWVSRKLELSSEMKSAIAEEIAANVFPIYRELMNAKSTGDTGLIFHTNNKLLRAIGNANQFAYDVIYK